jgi:hypothetical protein
MNKIIALVIIFPFSLVLAGQWFNSKTKSYNSVSDKMVSYSPSTIKMEGYLGEKMDLVIRQLSGVRLY